jgi:hypothetical protein
MAEAMLRCAAPPNIGQSCEISGKGATPASTSNVEPILTFIPFRKPPAQWRLIAVTELIGNCFPGTGMTRFILIINPRVSCVLLSRDPQRMKRAVRS